MAKNPKKYAYYKVISPRLMEITGDKILELRRFSDHFWRESNKNFTVNGYFLAVWEGKNGMNTSKNRGIFLDFLRFDGNKPCLSEEIVVYSY